MTRIILHIGPHKTGSTTVQRYLARNATALLAAGVDYPDLTFGAAARPSQRPLAEFCKNRPHRPVPGFEKQMQGWQPKAPTVLMSCEGFWPVGGMTAAMDRLTSRLPGITDSVAVLRDPVDHLRSRFRHLTRGPKRRRVQTLAEIRDDEIRKMQDPDRWSFYDYQRNLAAWRARTDLHLVRYRPGMDMVGALFTACGIAPVGPTAEPAANVGGGAEVTALYQVFNRLLVAGQIDAGQHKAAHDALGGAQGAALTRQFAPQMAQVRVDTAPFVDTFCHTSPDLAYLCAGSPDHLITFEMPVALDRAVWEAMRADLR